MSRDNSSCIDSSVQQQIQKKLIQSSNVQDTIIDKAGSVKPKNSKKISKEPKTQPKPWTTQEHSRFLQALGTYGNRWVKIKEHVGSRSIPEIRSYFQHLLNQNKQQNSNLKKHMSVQDSASMNNLFSLSNTDIHDQILTSNDLDDFGLGSIFSKSLPVKIKQDLHDIDLDSFHLDLELDHQQLQPFSFFNSHIRQTNEQKQQKRYEAPQIFKVEKDEEKYLRKKMTEKRRLKEQAKQVRQTTQINHNDTQEQVSEFCYPSPKIAQSDKKVGSTVGRHSTYETDSNIVRSISKSKISGNLSICNEIDTYLNNPDHFLNQCAEDKPSPLINSSPQIEPYKHRKQSSSGIVFEKEQIVKPAVVFGLSENELKRWHQQQLQAQIECSILQKRQLYGYNVVDGLKQLSKKQYQESDTIENTSNNLQNILAKLKSQQEKAKTPSFLEDQQPLNDEHPQISPLAGNPSFSPLFDFKY